MALSPVPDHIEYHVVRGDRFTSDVTLLDYDEVHADPASYTVKLVFRERQDDSLSDLLTLDGVLTAVPEAEWTDTGVSEVQVAFAATATETQGLPDYDIRYRVELAEVGGDPTRLYQGRVQISD